MPLGRREFLKGGFGAAAGLAIGAGLLSPSRLMAATARSRRRPNVLFIITDDQRLDTFGFLRGRTLTPNIDRLAAEGVYFSQAYVGSSLCTPSRFNCLTGKYASRCETEQFRRSTSAEGQTRVLWNTSVGPDRINLPQALRHAGYATGIVGKCHGLNVWSGGRYETVPLDSDPADPEVAVVLRENQARLVESIKKNGFDYAASLHRGNLDSAGVPCKAVRQHNIEWTVKGALEFIEQNKDRPFYLYLASTLLHGPSPLESLKSDPRITEAGLLDEPPDVQPSRQSVLERTRAAGVRDWLAPATWLDDGIGAVLRKLDELGLAEDTLVFYFNDHGVENGKGTCYDGGVRTPTIVRWKGTIAPGRCDEMVQNIDFAPTILDACGMHPPAGMHLDGASIMPLLTGGVSRVHDSLYFEVGYTRAVRTKRWKYIAFRIPPSRQKTREERRRMLEDYVRRREEAGIPDTGAATDPDVPFGHIGLIPGGAQTERSGLKRYGKHYYDADQLYDLAGDPDEQNNLAEEPAHKGKLAEMKALLEKHLAGLPGTFAEFKTG